MYGVFLHFFSLYVRWHLLIGRQKTLTLCHDQSEDILVEIGFYHSSLAGGNCWTIGSLKRIMGQHWVMM
jgi:hypothetical protein